MKDKRLIQKVIYAITAVLTPVIGALIGVFGSFLAGVSNMTNMPELPEDYQDRWAVSFSSDVAQAEFIQEGIARLVALSIVFLAGVVVLAVLSGRFGRANAYVTESNKKGIKLNWFDRIWSIVLIALFTLACTGAVCLCFPIVQLMPAADIFSIYKPLTPDNYYWGISNEFIIMLCGLGMLACVEIAILCLVSIIKKFKARAFWETSLLGGIANVVMEFFMAAGSEDQIEKSEARHRLGISAALILAAFLCTLVPWVGFILCAVLIIVFVPGWVSKFFKLRWGAAELKRGNLDYKLDIDRNEKGPKTEIDRLAEDINEISELTNLAVQNELKNQRMKTDLISNVSHDLKTPLTSMVTYLDLLKKEGLDGPKAAEYLAVIDEKTKRLQYLTEDLFEAAKASSGSLPCEISSIDANALLDQELAEMSDILDRNKLKVIKSCKAENTQVLADGRLLSRVLENLFGNIGKYALAKSRVYVDVTERSEGESRQLLIEIKNISRDALNISPEELMGRFTRGDEARNTEGSGLGLAISKDLVKLMKGSFEIAIDGDMFKASILLNVDNASQKAEDKLLLDTASIELEQME